MAILLAFSPFLAFFLLERLVSPGAGLIAGVVATIILLLRDRKAGKTPKLLEIGTVLLFAGLTVFHFATKTVWSIPATRLLVDAGLLLIVLVSLAAKQPFTLQYAREQVGPQGWNTRRFIRTNYVLTAVWAAAFALMVGADWLMLQMPTLPLKIGIGATILAIVGAYKFTSWYPEHSTPSSQMLVNEESR